MSQTQFNLGRSVMQWFMKIIYSGNGKNVHEQLIEFLNRNELKPEQVKIIPRFTLSGLNGDCVRESYEVFYFAEKEP